METRIGQIKEIKAAGGLLAEAGRIIRSGGLVAFPTETVYGLGANGLDGEACAGIYKAKGRPSDNPLILHFADREMVDLAARELSPLDEKLIAAFCPGPLTLIVRKKDCVPDRVTGGLPTVGVRIPDNDVARAFIREAGVPVAAPSANISGRPSPTTAAAVLHDMAGRIPLILDGGPCEFGVESTIVETNGNMATILRPGAITAEMLGELAERVELDPALAGGSVRPKAPGMKYTHYAPRVPLTLVAGKEADIAGRFRRELAGRAAAGRRTGIIVFEETAAGLNGLVPPELTVCLGKRGDLKTAAARLYEALRYFDNQEADSLLAEATAEEGLGLAIMNRLRKAAGGRIIGF